MSFRRCQNDDPFTRQVRALYAANVVRAPRAGIAPLDVLAVRKRHVEARGRLEGYLAADVQLPTASTAPAADMDGVRSTNVDLDVGLTLTATFLQALGAPIPGAQLSSTIWKGARALQFEVRDVKQHQVDLGMVGRALTGASIDRTSPAAAVFLTGTDIEMFIITRTLTSTQFAVRTSAGGESSASVSVDAIADLFGAVHTDVRFAREATDAVLFSGRTPVTFAFAAIPCVVQPDGRFLFGLEASHLTLGGTAPPLRARPLVDEDGLLDFDVPPAAQR